MSDPDGQQSSYSKKACQQIYLSLTAHEALRDLKIHLPSRLRLVLCPLDACHGEPHASSGLPLSKKLLLVSVAAALNPQTVEQQQLGTTMTFPKQAR